MKTRDSDSRISNNRLTQVGNKFRSNKRGMPVAVFKCECGRSGVYRCSHVARGETKSCGCARITHGRSDTPLYWRWVAMNERCHTESSSEYRNYGGRGIKVCERWRNSFGDFLSDMGEPGEGMFLDRINNDGNYEKENCRWVTKSDQERNKRTNRLITANGKTMCVVAWAEILSVHPGTLHSRMNRGLSDHDTINLPFLGRGRWRDIVEK